MSDNVTPLNTITTLDIPADRILDEARAEGLQSVIVVGVDEAGDFYFAASHADAGDTNYWLDRAKWRLMQQHDDLEAGE